MDERYLYCVTPAAHRPPTGLAGIAGAPVFAIVAEDLAVWVSVVPPGPLEAAIDAIQLHNAVVEAAVTAAVTPIPLRFGQRLPATKDVCERIVRERDRWREQLRLFAGTLEFGVRVLDPSRARTARVVHADPPVTGGRAYLEQIARRRAGERDAREEAERVAAELRNAVGGVAVREHVEALRTERGVASISHLVPRASFAEYRVSIARARVALPTLRLLVSGPWPPYSFAA